MTKLDAGGSEGASAGSKVNVAVRVRPFNKREIELITKCVVDMQGSQTILVPPPTVGKQSDKKQTKTFAFDHCFWSMDASQTDKFDSQEAVFKELGSDLLSNVFSGYNACIFAYGQTGSGKSYTMMGSHEQPGLIPRLCLALFEHIEVNTEDNLSFKVEVSYMEIYNEKVRDLLDPEGGKRQLRVREHKSLGPYVDGLQQLAASNATDVQELMSEGNKSRTIAATKMNAESSRSHAVFTLVVTQTLTDIKSGIAGEKVSKVSLVDLAGSERASKTGAAGDRLKEGSNINKSLTTLGLVISSLADQSSGKAKNKFVPYRDSTLTWILKDNLGGNSRTAMIATISPSADNYEETLSTLRYADRAKRIVNKAVINEDPNARIIRELREEVDKLQNQLKQSESMRAPDLKEKLEESEKLIEEISQTWEEKLRKTEEVHKQRQETLEKMGISLETSGIKVEKSKCFLVNLNADPSLNELLVYYLKPHTIVGQNEESDMQLSGLGISDKHCEMVVTDDGHVHITPMENSRTCVNGHAITSRIWLKHGDRILWGNNHFFRINIPVPVLVTAEVDAAALEADADQSLNESKIDYEFAQREVMLNQVGAPFQETIMHLEREFQQLEDATLHESSFTQLDMDERTKYEQEIKTLRKQLLSLSPRGSSDSLDEPSESENRQKGSNLNLAMQDATSMQYKKWKRARNHLFHASVTQLKEDLVKAQAVTQEANCLSQEMDKETEFVVTLQIPAHNLTPNRKSGTLLCVPAIQVIRQGRDCQVWSVEKLENRLVDMREMYLEIRDKKLEQDTSSDRYDPFIEVERNQLLIGVANVFLSCILQSSPFRYPVPIINQQGQIAGKLLVEIHRVGGRIPQGIIHGRDESSQSSDASDGTGDALSDSSSSGVGSSVWTDAMSASNNTQMAGDSNIDVSSSSIFSSSSSAMTHSPSNNVKLESAMHHHHQITIRISIIEAQGLSSSLSHFVQCQYLFLDCPDVVLVPPDLSPDELSPKNSRSALNIKFHHTTEFTCNVTEELVDRITSGSSLAIEVWGHRDRYNHHETELNGPIVSRFQGKLRTSSILSEKNKSLTERWSEVMKRLQMEIVILELGENAEYVPVEIINKPDIATKGVFQLKQGQSRRIQVTVETVDNSGTLPLIIKNISSMYAGSIQSQTTSEEGYMDSYQDNDLVTLRDKWLDVLSKRKEYLDQEIKRLAHADKSLLEQERESHLFDQWVTLTEERNAVEAPNSGIPGAPAAWNPPDHVEMHIPVLFFNINGDDRTDELLREPWGLDSCLPHELPGTYIQLPVIRESSDKVHNYASAIASWDSSLHDSPFLNRVTPSNERIHVIVKIHLRLSYPIEIDVVLRKRISVTVYKQKGFTAALMRRIQGKPLLSSGVVYELVSNIPLSLQDSEDRETLAVMAASGVRVKDTERDNSENNSSDSNENDDKQKKEENPFELYVTRSMQSVDDILSLDRIRQQVTLRELQHTNAKASSKNQSSRKKKVHPVI